MTDMGQPEFVSTSFHVLYKMFIIGREFILGRGVRGNSVPRVKFYSVILLLRDPSHGRVPLLMDHILPAPICI